MLYNTLVCVSRNLASHAEPTSGDTAGQTTLTVFGVNFGTSGNVTIGTWQSNTLLCGIMWGCVMNAGCVVGGRLCDSTINEGFHTDDRIECTIPEGEGVNQVAV